MLKINMKREYLITLKKEKTLLNLQQIKNHVATFSYWFWFGKTKF
jgi:hypothetical protein